MRALTSHLALAVCGVFVCVGSVCADQDDELTRELRMRVVLEGGIAGEHAAADLFEMGLDENDAFLLEQLASEDNERREARLCILRALRNSGRLRPDVACGLVFEAMDDPVPAVAKLAAETFTAVEDEQGRTFVFVRKTLLHPSSLWARPGTPRGRKALALVEVLPQLRDQIEATGVLVELLESRPGRALEQKVRETLARMTSQEGFDAAREWRTWYDEARERSGGSLSNWRRAISRYQSEVLDRYEQEADRYFLRLLDTLEGDPEALFQELSEALARETVPAIRRRALQRLGDLAREGSERAINLLRARLSVSTDYDEDAAVAIQQLGRTGEPALLPAITPYLEKNQHPNMRQAAVAALSGFKDPSAVDAVLALLRDVSNPDELLEAAIDTLGAIGRNGDGRVSHALVQFAHGHLLSNGSTVTSRSLLAHVAQALGKLRYAPEGESAAEALELLTHLASVEDDANVRLYAVSALGFLPHPAAFPFLVERLDQEGVHRVIKMLLDSTGQQAFDHPEFRDEAVKRLVPFLDHPEETGVLRRISRRRLGELCDAQSGLRWLELLVRTLFELRPETGEGLAQGFLNTLPPLGSVLPTDDERVRFRFLLGVRAKGRLTDDREGALTDMKTLIEAGAPRRAFDLAILALQTPPDTAAASAAWTVALDALDGIRSTDPATAAELHTSLAEHLPAAPAEARRRYEAMKGSG